MFSEQTLESIRNQISIVDLIGEYVALKKSGQGFTGLCPFHSEKTPSFHVHPMKQCFHCFGCHKGGNIFTFLSAIEGLRFPEAVERLAKKAGVTLERTYIPQSPKISIQDEQIYKALDWAAKYFHYVLEKSPEAAAARAYLKGRGLTEKSVKQFQIGYAPNSWNQLLGAMTKRGFPLQLLVQSGLVVEKKESTLGGYDRFRHRIQFPIRDREGRVVGFGGRILNPEDQPKYLNSAESTVFSKRKILYGLYENQRGIRLKGELLVVEGYMDVVGLFEAGVENAVATMGTAMTEEHCSAIRPLTRKLTTLFDPDAAGEDAWRRSVHLLIEQGMIARDLSLPEGLDPDEFALKYGAPALYELVATAPRHVTKLLKSFASRENRTPEEIAAQLEMLTPILVATRNSTERAALWDDISLVMKVSIETLKALSEPSSQRRPQSSQPPQQKTLARFTPPRSVKLPMLEREFLVTVLSNPARFLEIPQEDWFPGIQDARVKDCLTLLHGSKDLKEFQEGVGKLIQTTQDEALGAILTEQGLKEDGENGPDLAYFEQLMGRLKQRKLEAQIKALSVQVKLTGRSGDGGEQLRLLEQLHQLRGQLDKPA